LSERHRTKYTVTVVQQYRADDIRLAVKLMAEKIKTTLACPAKSRYQDKKIVRLTVQVPDQPMLPWLRSQNFSLKTYWSDRSNQFEIAGVGAVDFVGDGTGCNYHEVFGQLCDTLCHSDPDIRYYGGFTFAPDQATDDSWKRFGRYYFILPQFELIKTADNTHFVCNVRADIDRNQYAAMMSQLEALTFEFGNISCEIPQIVSEEDFPEKSRWMAIVQSALEAFKAHRYEKIVLARKRALEFVDKLNPFILLQKLKETASNSYTFCFQPEDNLAFIGASPELLYYREGRQLQSEAVAGTRTRGRTEAEDHKFGEELLRSEKDLREHRYVIDCIKNACEPLANPGLNCNDSYVSLLKLARVQHLATRFNLKLKDNVSDAELISALHPTAAVGGYPKDRIVDEIIRLEGFNRGWYAAPVGWVERDAAEFVVAIRSGLVQDNCLSLFSGAGIINGSVPDNEWEEMDNKIDMFLRVLT